MIHFSVDDVIEIFKNLSKNRYASCFDEPSLSFFRELHAQYGFSVALYCFYEDCSGFDLSAAPRRFFEEFRQNADWLTFGFHGLNRRSNYADCDIQQFLSDANKVYSNLRQAVSESALTYDVRLSFASGNFDCVAAFKKAYPLFHTLYGADDRRIEYYLSASENAILLEHGFFRDDRIGITIQMSQPRLEKLDSPPLMPDRNDCAFFTHECRLDDPLIRERITWLCRQGRAFSIFEIPPMIS